jgi:dTDP-4-dehydrorhamnose reductase
MILLLGASGYVGQAFARELHRRRSSFIPLARTALDYTSFDLLFDYVRKVRPEFIINAAGYTGKPNVDACEATREETLFANTLLPQTIARVCLLTNTPWGHISSGGIYTGAKIADGGKMREVRDLNQPQMRRLFEQSPESFFGFAEWDEPNFSFRHAPCNFYSGTKALAEEAIRGIGQSYIWRPGTPFGEHSEPRNFLWKLQHYPKVYDAIASLSHLDDFVRASLDLWEYHAPFGIYNMTNPGAIATRQVIEMIQQILKPARRFEYWKDDEEFYSLAAGSPGSSVKPLGHDSISPAGHLGAKAPRSHAILDVSKLLTTGVKMRPVKDALENSLRNWREETPAGQLANQIGSAGHVRK